MLLVTTYMFSEGQIFDNLSNVCCISVFPVPKTSINCFGCFVLLIGQNRLPIPPAIITA